MKILNNILTEFAQDPANAHSTFVWGRNRFKLSFDWDTEEITVLNLITWDVVCESACLDTLATAIHAHRR